MLAEPMAQGRVDEVVEGFLLLGDLEGLKKFTPSDYDWTGLLGKLKLPPLVYLVGKKFISALSADSFLQLAEWIIRSGADPQQAAPIQSKSMHRAWVQSKQEDTLISVDLAGQSAISAAFLCMRAMREGMGDADWSEQITDMEKFLSVATRHWVSFSKTDHAAQSQQTIVRDT